MGRMDDLADDWQGVDASPGVAARPGVMARLDPVEGRVGTLEHELRPNSGRSLRDVVTATVAPEPSLLAATNDTARTSE
uniref:hypothetical protein n=1 Tax=Streptomyces chartreusis TaxID=1969 RepID=UPI003F4997BA